MYMYASVFVIFFIDYLLYIHMFWHALHVM